MCSALPPGMAGVAADYRAMMYQSQGNYIYCMALIPLAYFLAQEKVMTRQNIIAFCGFDDI